MTNVGNGMLDRIPGEQPAEPPATPGTVTVWLKIQYSERVNDVSEVSDAESRAVGIFCVILRDRLTRLADGGYGINDIETESEFEPDQDPGDKR